MKLTAKQFYVLICDDSQYCDKGVVNRMICGVYASASEAKEAAKEIKSCVCKHYIKKCTVTVEI